MASSVSEEGPVPGNRTAWIVALASLVALIPSAPALGLYTQGFFIAPVTKEFGWTRTQFMSAVSTTYLLVALLNPIVGYLTDRYGVRRLLLIGIPLYGFANILLATVNGDMGYYWTVTMATGFLSIMATPLIYAKAIAGWADRRRGLAMAIGLSGVAIGNILLPPVTAWLIEAHGWRGGRIGHGLMVLLLSLPAIYFFIHEPAERAAAHVEAQHRRRFQPRALLRDPVFLLLAVAFSLSGMALNGSLVHLIPMLTDHGFAMSVATAGLSAMAVAQLCGRLASGFFLDRIVTPKIGLIWFVVGIVGLALAYTAHDAVMLFPAVVLIGFALGSEVELAAYYAARFFGLDRFGESYGMVTMAYGVGNAIGGLVLGFSFDRTGSYVTGMVAVIAMLAVSCVATLLLPPYRFAPSER